MKLFFLFFFPILVFGQVGINKPSPKASLDIYGFPDDPSKSSGFIAPRLTLSQLNSKLGLYNKESEGAILYITNLDMSLPYPKVLRYVVSPGYYFYNGDYWERLETESGMSVLVTSTNLIQLIPANSYTVINSIMVSDPLVRWNSSKSSYTIPISGVYLILSDIELDINGSRNIYLAVNDINNQDIIIDGVWKYTPMGRFTFPYTRIGYFDQGTELVFYSYSIDNELEISGAELSITLLKAIVN